jgi:hypothetical protein
MAARQRFLASMEIGGSHRSIVLTCQAGPFSWRDSRYRSRTNLRRLGPSRLTAGCAPTPERAICARGGRVS